MQFLWPNATTGKHPVSNTEASPKVQHLKKQATELLHKARQAETG